MGLRNTFMKLFRKAPLLQEPDMRFTDVLWNKRCVFKSLVTAIEQKLRIELPDCISWRFMEEKPFDLYISGCKVLQIAAKCAENIIDILIDTAPYLKRRQEIVFKYLPITQRSQNKIDLPFVAKTWVSENIALLLDAFKDADDESVTVTLDSAVLPRDVEAWPDLVDLLMKKGMNAKITENAITITLSNEQEAA